MKPATAQAKSTPSRTVLVQAVGPERFARFFVVNRWITPTKAYTEQFYTAFDDGQRAALKGMVKQYKPSIKTR